MFEKILIANRGEIAVRIIKSAKRLGIKTVAIYSDADTNALHVKLANEAVYVGPSPANQSYLNVDNVIDAIMQTGAQAVHPGYGFLSENGKFAEKLHKAGVAFIGPSIKAIKGMGDKIEAKKIAKKAGVNTIPGYMGVIKNEKEAAKIAKDIGYPVMFKAAAGGGGKGMRIVRKASEVKQAFSSVANEARNSFSDDRIFIEKLIESPRHIEIQLLGDKHGNYICLGERECSIQRHHQKVIEEAPSPFIDQKTREKMYKQVVSLAKQVKYDSAGTVEFIVDAKKNFYFLEMNTRLQVEHPVTELITGVDLVEQMIRVAAGEKLTFSQKDIALKGWAMESRLYAEDPSRGFLPSSGRIHTYQEPDTNDNVRVDTGVYEGGEVSMFYDPMIAKLCTYGETRKEAIEHMQKALGNFVLGGVAHNISFLEAVMAHPRFTAGDITTHFISEEYPDGFEGAELTSETSSVFLATAVHIYLLDAYRAARIEGQLPGRERQIGTRWIVTIDNVSYSVYVAARKGGFNIKHDGEDIKIRSSWVLGNHLFQGTVNDKPISVKIDHFAGGMYLTHAGSTVTVTVRSPRVAELSRYMPVSEGKGSTMYSIEAPISGMMVSVKVKEGDEVKEGQELMVVESMKMENIIYAEHDVIVKSIHTKEGEVINVGQLLMEFDSLVTSE